MAGHTGDVETATEGLSDEDPGVRAAALGALHRLGRLSASDVADASTDSAVEARRRAAELAPAYGVDVGFLLDDPDWSVVEMAAWACGELGLDDEGTVDALARTATRHGDALCREAAVAALGAIGAEAGLDAILHATGDKPAVRRRAVVALAAFEGPQVDEALAAAVEDRDWQVRQAAAELLDVPFTP